MTMWDYIAQHPYHATFCLWMICFTVWVTFER